jgi:hypothetical protein
MKAPKQTVATASFHAPGQVRTRSGRAGSCQYQLDRVRNLLDTPQLYR